MATVTIDVNDLPEAVRAAVEQAANGGDVVIVSGGKPTVRLTPVRRAIIFNMHPGAMQMAPNFDDPLPDEFWLGATRERPTRHPHLPLAGQ